MTGHNWKAKWIWKNASVEINQFAYFRKEINIRKNIRAARVFVSAHNHFELYIGGIKVSGYVTPAPTHPKKSKYYLTYDITSLLKTGMNSICAVAHYMGGDGQNYVNGLPGFILQCEIEYDNSLCETVITDESWKVLDHTPYANGTEFQQNRRISAIEVFDAAMEDQWHQTGYDDTHWTNTVLSLINSEGWMLKPQTIPEGKIHEIIVPALVGIQEKGLQVFDAGKIITGWPRLDLKGMEGVQLMLGYSEDMTGDGRVGHNVCNEKSENYYDLYKMKGEGWETWEPALSYKAFRYVEATGYPELLEPENIKIISAGTGLSYEGAFHCSSPLLNSIYEACIQTQKNNVTGQMVDCPHREQAQYLADSDLQAETFIYSFFNPEVLKKVLLDFIDGQFEDGRFQFVFPSNITPKFDIKIPEWDLHFCTLLWKVYYYYGDVSFLAQCYKAAQKVVGYYTGAMDKITGLVPKGKGFPEEWNISDWPYPNIDNTGSALTVQNCLLCHVLVLMSEMAAILGFEKDREVYLATSLQLKNCIVKQLYNADKGLFADSLGSVQFHQGTNVVAFQYGLVPEKDQKAVLEFIAGEGFGCSTLLTLNLLQILFENGKKEEAYNLINNSDYPGWGYMLSQGYKTIWEGFQNIESHSHAWNAYPARIFAEYLVGIKAVAPGFSKIAIQPYMPPDLDYAEGKVPTIQGDVYVKWEKNHGKILMKVELPSGTKASVHFPKPDNAIETITEAGNVIWNKGIIYNKDGIRYSNDNKDHIIFIIEPGRYIFELS